MSQPNKAPRGVKMKIGVIRSFVPGLISSRPRMPLEVNRVISDALSAGRSPNIPACTSMPMTKRTAMTMNCAA